MIDITIEPGTYVVAVSGGVDSVVLLDILCRLPDVRLIVAHFDHGIRADSVHDRRLVQQLSAAHELPFVFENGRLGPAASEAAARTARYDFLQRVLRASSARAIVTAHHQDDVIETALLNMLRGTNRRGLSSLTSRDTVLRPLLAQPKADVLSYAETHNLSWREDSTNRDETYKRNMVRRQLVPKLSPEQRAGLTSIIRRAAVLNNEIDALLITELELLSTPQGLRRQLFIGLDHQTAREIMAAWLRNNGIRDYDRPMLERLAVAAKTARPGAAVDVLGGARLSISKDFLALVRSQR